MGILFTKCFSKKQVEDVTFVINAVDETLDAIDEILDDFKKDITKADVGPKPD